MEVANALLVPVTDSAKKVATMHLTNKGPIRSNAFVASGCPDAAGAPADEIEITAEMIEAGVKVMFNYDPEFSNEKDIVAEIFMAMTLSANYYRERL